MEENISCWCSHSNICASSECCVMCYWFTEMIQNDSTKLFIPQRPCCSKHRTSINQCFVHWGHKALQIPFVLKAHWVTLPFVAAHLRTTGFAPACALSRARITLCAARFRMIGWDGDTDVPGWFTLTRTKLGICMLMSAQPWLLLTVWKNFISITEGERFPRSAGRTLHSLRVLFHLAGNRIHFTWTTPRESFPVAVQNTNICYTSQPSV